MKALILPITLFALSACGAATPRMDADSEAMIDCLASQAVVEISDAVKTGMEAGKSADALRPIRGKVTDAKLKELQAVYTEQKERTYFEFQTAKRLNAVQEALADPENASSAKTLMDETFALAQDCTFGPTS